MKKTLSLLLSFIILLSLTAGLDFSVHASDIITGVCGENVTFSLDTESGELTISGSGEMYDYGSDDAFLQEDNLSPFSFCYNDNIKSATINSGVTSIGDNAFTNCVSLNYVTIPDSVIRIGSLAFFECSNLITIDVDSDNTAFSSQDGVLFNKDKTELILLPIKSNNAEYTIPNTVTKIDEYAFNDNSSTKTLTISRSVVSIGDYALDNSNFANINVDSENSVFSSKKGVLFNKDKTELIKFPCDNEISNYAVPDTVKKIDKSAFYYSLRLTSVTIPASVTEIGERAFASCWNLYKITVDSENTAFCSQDGVLFNKNKTELIQYNYADSKTDYTVPDGVTRICDYAFYNSVKLTSAAIPDSVKYIGNYAFNFCFELTELKMGKGVTFIGDNAFSYCKKMNDIALPSSLTSIGTNAFYCCNEFTGITVPENVSYIGEAPFALCSKLKYIDVSPDNNAYCSQNGVLFNKNKTKLIQFPMSSDLTVFSIPESVTAVGEYALYRCASLTEISIPDSVSEIGMLAFGGCPGLTDLTLSDGIETISVGAFSACNNLNVVSLPESIKNFKYAAFANCTAIKDVYYNGTRKQWSKITTHLENECLTGATIHCTDGTIDSEHPYIPNEDESDGQGSEEPENPSGETPVSPAVENKKPSRVKIKRIKPGKRKFTVIWNKAKRAKGYIIQYSLSKKFKKSKKYNTAAVTVKNAKAVKKTVRKLKSGKRYYIRIRAFNGTSKNKRYGKWSKVKSVKVK